MYSGSGMGGVSKGGGGGGGREDKARDLLVVVVGAGLDSEDDGWRMDFMPPPVMNFEIGESRVSVRVSVREIVSPRRTSTS